MGKQERVKKPKTWPKKFLKRGNRVGGGVYLALGALGVPVAQEGDLHVGGS